MLHAMRQGAQYFAVKLFLGLVALSFVAWGVGDMLRAGGNNAVAKVGKTPISQGDYQNAVQQQVARYQQMFGTGLTQEQIAGLGIGKMALESLVERGLIEAHTEKLGIHVSDKTIRDRIVNNPLFQNEEGSFDKERFRQIIRANGTSEERLEQSIIMDASVKLLLDSMTSIAPVSDAHATALLKARLEKREFDVVTLPLAKIAITDAPTDSQLQQYYQENAGEFMMAEHRDVTYVILNLAELQKSLEITQEQIIEHYNANQDIYSKNEERQVGQYRFETQEEAMAAKAEIEAGATEAYSEQYTDLGSVTGATLPTTKITQVVFGAEAESYTDPIDTGLGWNIYHVKSIEESSVRPLEDVKAEIKSRIREEEAEEELFAIASKVEDDIASGLGLEDVAKTYNLKIKKIQELTETGSRKDGRRAEFPGDEEFLKQVFTTEADVTTPLTLLPDNETYYMARVDNIVPTRLRALDEVKGTVTQLWKEAKRAEKAIALVEEWKEQGGGSLSAFAAKHGFVFKANQLASRNETDKWPATLLNSIFSLPKDAISELYLLDEKQMIMGQLKAVNKIDPEGYAGELAEIKKELRYGFENAVLEQYSSYLRSQYPVTYYVKEQ